MNVQQLIQITKIPINKYIAEYEPLKDAAFKKQLNGESIESKELRQAIKNITDAYFQVCKILGKETNSELEAEAIATDAFIEIQNLEFVSKELTDKFTHNNIEYEILDCSKLPYDVFAILSDLTGGYYEFEQGQFVEVLGFVDHEKFNFDYLPEILSYIVQEKGFILTKENAEQTITERIESYKSLPITHATKAISFFLRNLQMYKRKRKSYSVSEKLTSNTTATTTK